MFLRSGKFPNSSGRQIRSRFVPIFSLAKIADFVRFRAPTPKCLQRRAGGFLVPAGSAFWAREDRPVGLSAQSHGRRGEVTRNSAAWLLQKSKTHAHAEP